MNIKSIAHFLGFGVWMGLLLLTPAKAEFVLSIQQSGVNVVATGSGSIDTADLTVFTTNNSGGSGGEIIPVAADFLTSSAMYLCTNMTESLVLPALARANLKAVTRLAEVRFT